MKKIIRLAFSTNDPESDNTEIIEINPEKSKTSSPFGAVSFEYNSNNLVANTNRWGSLDGQFIIVINDDNVSLPILKISLTAIETSWPNKWRNANALKCFDIFVIILGVTMILYKVNRE